MKRGFLGLMAVCGFCSFSFAEGSLPPFLVVQQKVLELDQKMEGTQKNIEQLSKNDELLEARLKKAETEVENLNLYKKHVDAILEALKQISDKNSEHYIKIYDEQRKLQKKTSSKGSEQNDGLAKQQKDSAEKIKTMNQDIDVLFSKILDIKGSIQKMEKSKDDKGEKAKIDEITKNVDGLGMSVAEIKSTLQKIEQVQKENIKAFDKKEVEEVKKPEEAKPSDTKTN